MDSVEERSGYYSELASDYARYRPSYPEELFQFLAEVTPGKSRVWDCGTGNGQAAIGLVNHFDSVTATDIDPEQIRHAFQHDRIDYQVMPAEQTTFEDSSFDLITVAQAVHWFDLERFYQEAKRCLKKGGIVAAWTYKYFSLAPYLDELIDYYYDDLLFDYWPHETKLVEGEYRELPFPFEEIETPDLYIVAKMTFEELCGYLSSSSCVQVYREDIGKDPIEVVLGKLREHWGSVKYRTMNMPIHLRVGRVIH